MFDMSFAGIIIGFFTGAIACVGSGLILAPACFIFETGKYIYKIYSENKKREEKIRWQFKFYFNTLEIIKKNILAIMYETYHTKNNDIRRFKISQQNPMKKIYSNNEIFKKIVEQFKNICLEFK